jgi:hypothetical protein
MSILCLFGRHDGYWSYADPDDHHSCRQFRLCQRTGCKATEERVWHDIQFPPDGRVRYLADEDCWAQGACTRCGTYGGQVQVVHRWGPFTPRWDDDGRMVVWHVCGHCGRYEEKIPAGTEYAY